MNDRFKFRAWELGNNKYYFFDLEQGLSNAIEEMVNYKGIGTIEQSTGLKDKNGKLIFEGDIIKITRGEKPKMFNIPQIQITDVYYDKGAFRYRWGDGSGSVIDFNSVEIVKGCESITQDVEVIGNIHQNRELLEKGGK